MAEHVKLSDIPEFCAEVEKWLKDRYGEEEGAKLWEATGQQYNQYLEELPDYGGKKASHAIAIYGSIVFFSMYPLLPDHPPVEGLQEFVTNLFMSQFVKLGKVFNLNRSFDMWLIKKVFQNMGKKTKNNTHNIRQVSAMYQSHTIRRTMPPDIILHNAPMRNLRKSIIWCRYFRFSAIQTIGGSVRFMELWSVAIPAAIPTNATTVWSGLRVLCRKDMKS